MAIMINEVAEIPKAQKHRRANRSEILGRLEDCMAGNISTGMVIFTDGDYASVTSARASLRSSAERYGYPLQFETRANKLYFRRTDY